MTFWAGFWAGSIFGTFVGAALLIICGGNGDKQTSIESDE